ncbi:MULTISPECIES: CopG family transcriptional regulator [Rhizobium/Agrobacterium group]|uniref:ribbon-helix-helix domain-containing protein n=1 Tax=Rhizobium/Agrobacterium group TaxID=227290 RepID=UPI0012E92D85|nr:MULTISPECIES: CopG family transcriptional regulator [Rhizobium/Agrobacterium group]MCF1473020.1 ribbon-helix-helix protein, CopG family [Allorhizobium ampelinum]MVA53269.1 ribbon-helix-helix protein, CopG family [Agrobacterium vitis]NSZ52064.1 ribbon-helix-helix protein, CopG family [Agrobacterium vitis]NTA30823.1 ribbon-helix-helix protein, CopG family [Agrobacterium vitis]
MRTLIDLDDDAVLKLDRIARQEKISRAALIRQAVASLLEERQQPDLDHGFGLWKNQPDGLAYQQALRDEW